VGISGGRANTAATSSLAEGGPRADRDLLNFFAAYKRNKITLQAEYLEGDARAELTPGVLSVRELRGYYGSVGYLFTPKLEGVFRYDYLDGDRNGSGDTTVRDLILGLNYYLKGTNAKFQLNLVKRSGANDLAFTSSNPHQDLRNDRTEVRTNFQVAF
jgi:hypothetical protein